MWIRLLPKLLAPAIFAAAVAAYFLSNRDSPAASPAAAESPAAADLGPVPMPPSPGAFSGSLPPNHPPVQGMSDPHGGMDPHGGGMAAMPNGDNQEAPALTWTVPKGWQTVANPNPMRLATYKVSDAAEVSVARAGGTTEANVDRWTAQFEATPKVARTDKQVHGLRATVVRIDGSFRGGGMMGGAPEKHDGWSMLAAIVESAGSPYFFKMVGPSAEVDRARTSFDALLGSVAPPPASPPL